jgi:hypothetical protein
MKTQDFEEGDDVVFMFLGDTLIEVFENEDIDLHQPVEETFAKGDEIDVTVCSVDERAIGIQFGDGSITFIHPESVEFLRFS